MESSQMEHEFLRGIIEDYKYTEDSEKKKEIFNEFTSKIWGSSNKRRTLTKTIRFDVRNDLINTEVGKIFDTWSEIEYRGYRSTCKTDKWYDLIRQKINNIYTIVFDKTVIIKKEYMDLLKTPRRLYYEWLDGRDFEPDVLTIMIDEAISDSLKAKERFEKEKIDYSWEDYKKLITDMLYKCFEKCMLLEEYEEQTQTYDSRPFGHFISDHFYVSYICKSLDGMIRKWEKSYYNLPLNSRKSYKRCASCGKMIIKTANRQIYCQNCAAENKKNSWKKASKKYRHKLENAIFISN